MVLNNLCETLSGHRTNAEAFESRIINSNNLTPANVELYLANASSNVYTPTNNVSTVSAGNITYSNTEFSPTGVDALTPDIGAMFYFGNFWEAGITWNNTTSSDSDYVTNNRLNFSYTSSGNPSSYATDWDPATDLTTVAWIDASDTSSYTVSGSNLTAVTDKSGTYTMSVNNTPTVGDTLNSLPVFTFANDNESLKSTSFEQVVSNSGNHWAIGVFRWDSVNNSKDSFWSFETNQSPKRDYAVSSSSSSNSWPGELDLSLIHI